MKPGGGALTFDVGYKNNSTIYLRGDKFPDALDDTFEHAAFFEAKWKFLPKTALSLYTDFGFFSVANPEVEPSTLEGNPFHVTFGLVGQVTRKISAELRVGYGETLTWEKGREFSRLDTRNQRALVGIASATWEINRKSSLSLAYQRDVMPTGALSSFTSDAVRLRGHMQIQRLTLGAYAEAQFREFGNQFQGAGGAPSATVLIGGARADYYFLDYLSGGINYRVSSQTSNDADRLLPEGQGVSALAESLGEFDRHQLFVNIILRY